jgi:CelD/BcsL family acetyltransferase involved in cellulose biosynthesis
VTYSVVLEKLENLARYYAQPQNALRWPSVFMLPGWLDAWWQSFGTGYMAQPLLVCRDGEIIGVAPLKMKDGVASFIGDNSVCDYLDFITAPSAEEPFATALLDYLKSQGVRILLLETLRPDSVACVSVAQEAQRRGWALDISCIETSDEMELPSDWDNYLASLRSHQRRDIERKIRQLEKVAPLRLEVLCDTMAGETELDTLFHMMADSRRDKGQFLTENMRTYFYRLASALAGYGLLRLAFLYAGVVRVAGVLYFDYHDRIYLYNSGYVPQYAGLNAGLVSKLYVIRQAIADGKKVFDFLKGPEVYKTRLGGRRIDLLRCNIVINQA